MDFTLTLLIAFIVTMVAACLLGLGLILTGKSKVKLGSCGRDPNKKQNDDCGTDVSCTLCDKKEGKK